MKLSPGRICDVYGMVISADGSVVMCSKCSIFGSCKLNVVTGGCGGNPLCGNSQNGKSGVSLERSSQ